MIRSEVSIRPMREVGKMDDVLCEFIAESWESLNQLDSDIVELEKRHGDPELLASVFRTIHTIKGTCGFIGLTKLGALAHSTENVLGQMRDGKLEPSNEAFSITLQAVDEIKELLTAIETTGQEPDRDHGFLINQLELLVQLSEESQAQSDDPESSTPSSDLRPDADTCEVSPVVATDKNDQDMAVPNTVVVDSDQSGNFTEPPPSSTAAQASSVAAPAPPSSATVEPAAPTGRSVSDLSIRVNVDVIDSLMNMVGELVLTRNQLLQLARGDEESKYVAPITHLNRVTSDLQEGVMKTRMQPISSAWAKMPRLVRDLCQVTGKQIELEMHGAETELDRTVLDAIKDPLTHMVRNSADHGIESSEERVANSKPEIGTLRLNAYHEGGHVIICVEDDGAGINLERVRQKAIANGVVSEADASRMSEHELTRLILAPGFSTAETVTSVSGRGVGMDVVRTQIEAIGGTVDLLTQPGKGTTVRIKIPLTLAIVSALVVESGGQSFAIPQLGVVELVRLAVEDRKSIERIHNHMVFRLRDRLLPLVRLDDILQLDQKPDDDESDINIVVVQIGDEQLGLVVDEVFDTEEIVVKPVGQLLRDIGIYQGTTILGDGRVIIILDVAGIAAEIGDLNAIRKEAAIREAEQHMDSDLTSILMFNAGEGRTMSVPLSLVSRLEEIAVDRIEHTGDRDVVQYRGDLLPLLPIDDRAEAKTAGVQPVIVFSENNKTMGLMVEDIEDIIEETLVIRMQSKQPGVLGTAIVSGHATDILDAQHYVMRANPSWFENNQVQNQASILLAEDSVFFRQLATTSLEAAGYQVTAVEDGGKAVAKLEQGETFELIISDIEMPVMGGLEVAQWVRERERFADIPMIALSGNTNPSLQARAIEAGFHRFMRKFDPAELKAVVDSLCAGSTSIQGVSA